MNHRKFIPLFTLLVFASWNVHVPLHADATKAKKKSNPAMSPPKADPNLPNVLLIGDSISIGYTIATREALKGIANVYRPLTNCGPTTRGIEGLDDWLGDRKWDVIHFNFGLHDLKYMGPNKENLAKPDSPASRVQVPMEEYESNIETIARCLKSTGARVIWRDTTPVPEGARGRVVGDSKRYNESARRAIARVDGIEIDPFYDYALEHSELQKKADVHYTPAGSKVLGEHVAEVIKKALK